MKMFGRWLVADCCHYMNRKGEQTIVSKYLLSDQVVIMNADVAERTLQTT